MLFDLQGKRRRVVQATYLTLALLMGGGLVLFGIGGDVAGGLFDAFSERGGGSSDVSEQQQKALDDAEEDLKKNPQDAEALQTIVRLHANLARNQADPETGLFTAKGRSELFAATTAWERYLTTNPNPPDEEVAGSVVSIYAQLGEYKKAASAAEVVTEQNPSVDAYLELAQFATWSKDKDTASQAGDKAIELSPDDQRSETKNQVKLILKSKAPPQAPAQAPPGGGPNVFEQPGEEGQGGQGEQGGGSGEDGK